jgi:hypothetical protein
MPRKACCCTTIPPELGSCCRPIYNGCVGKEYTFTFRFSAKYPCMNLNGTPAIYQCDNNSSISYNIPGNFETFEVTCAYLINSPAEIRAEPACIGPGNSNLTSNCGNWGCQGSGFNPMVPSTWKYCSNPIFSCLKCNCYTNSNYSYCNFDGDKLKTSCNCFTGFIPFIYNCTLEGNNVFQLDGTNPAPCGEDGFGNIRPFTLIQEGNSQLIDLWSACYRSYILKENDFGFSDLGCGCTFDPGSDNLLDSYTVQFIPDPNIPEQNDINYIPKIKLDLIKFNFNCSQDGNSTSFILPGYNINLSLGIGYDAEFNCGTVNNPISEYLTIPFQICEDTFFGGIYYDGLYVEGNYNRSSFTTDPFDLCIPPSTTNHIKDNSGGRCNIEVFYSDGYFGDSGGLIGNAGIPSNDFGSVVPQPNLPTFCKYSFDPSLPDSLYCDYLRFSNKILVSEV